MHLKRLNTPKRWNVPKKTTTFIARPRSGAHPQEMALPLVVVVRDHLKLVENKKACKRLLNNKEIYIDGKPVHDTNYAVGLFDVLSLPNHKLYYRISLDYKGGIVPIEIGEKESDLKLLRIINKTRIKGGKIQLNCSGSRNIVVEKDKYKTGDSLLYNLKSKKIEKHIPMKEGAKVFVTQGKHAGEMATIKGFKLFEGITPDRVILENEGQVYETMKGYVFVVGDKKSEITIREGAKK